MRMRPLLSLLFLVPLLATAQTPPPKPAAAASPPAAANDAELKDIRTFARVYHIIRQAYVEKISNKTLMDAAINGMLTGIDPHSEFLDRKGLQALSEDTTGEYAGLGIEVAAINGELRIISPIDDTPAARAGIKPGDTVLKVNGKPVDPNDVNRSIDQLRGKPGTRISLTILHDGASKPIDVKLIRERINVPSVRVRELEPGYAYIRISQFQENTASDLDRKLTALIKKDGTQAGAVLDLRSNPGGLVTAAVGVADTFLNSGAIVRMRGRLPDANLSFNAHPGDMLHHAPMVLLVDNGTASAAEIVAGALKDHHRALIMGQRTFGKGVVQTVIPVDADHAVKLTTARYYTPDGTSIQAEGIVPDIVLPNLIAKQGNRAPSLVGSEADLPNHLANEHPEQTRTHGAATEQASLAERDYALGEALNVLKGLALSRRPPPAAVAR
jgi:carboxyl-terminal processing protease